MGETHVIGCFADNWALSLVLLKRLQNAGRLRILRRIQSATCVLSSSLHVNFKVASKGFGLVPRKKKKKDSKNVGNLPRNKCATLMF